MMLSFILLFPFFGFLINGLWYSLFQTRLGSKKAGSFSSGMIASLGIFLSFLVSAIVFFDLAKLAPENRLLEQFLFNWIGLGPLQLDVVLRADSLSIVFCLIITGVGTLIHIYSIGYMSHDATPAKFFAYLNLFCFAMLILVLGGSLPILFVGWEGVGLCSYLLIGYWYQDEEKAKAGKKAFIVNRIGDFGFLLGMFLIYSNYKTLDFVKLASMVPSYPIDTALITAMGCLLFVGCVGKSAQFPLYVWLPDAMAGPTPVSALIHAATMVTSGIYLVSRMNFLYRLSPTAMALVAVIGGLTAFLAATIAFCQKDIKKVLAYSTVSQLGYMFLGCGVGAFSAGVFHVMTHAFFKALLFLGAGSVIHGMHEEQDICKMGGLKTKMPKTFLTFAVGWVAICGIPPFSGFFSKDEILWKAFSSPHGSLWLWMLGAITAVMTAFYMTRLFALVFFGTPRFDEKKMGHLETKVHAVHQSHDKGQAKKQDKNVTAVQVHESPALMTVPLQILAVLSATAGLLGIPHLHWGLESWLEPIFAGETVLREGVMPSMEWLLMVVSVLGAGAGIFIAFRFYKNLPQVEALSQRWGFIYQILEKKWYVDEIYESVFVKPIHACSQLFWRWIDVGFIDRVIVGLGRSSEWTGQWVRMIQNGSIQLYGLMLLMGIVATVGYLIYGMAN